MVRKQGGKMAKTASLRSDKVKVGFVKYGSLESYGSYRQL
jgi:hypothetical protein